MNTPKRMVALTLAILLAFSCVSALAETTIMKSWVAEGRNVSFNRHNNTVATYVTEKSNSYYVLTDAFGNRLTSDYYLMMDSKYGFWKVALESGTNTVGLIDGTGAVVLPLAYGAIDIISDKWTIGVELTPATVDQYDYKSVDGKSFYLVSAYDVYFEGAKVGSLSRTEYRTAYAHEDYLYVQDGERNYHYYNKNFVESGCSESSSTEYYETYKSGEGTLVWHSGSGQQAFTAGCTLTSDEVDLDVYVLNGQILDLQGNVLAEVNTHYDYIRKFCGDYTVFRSNGKYGLLDRTGNVVLAAEYDEIPYFTANDGTDEERYFACGYQAVVKDGKLGYVHLDGTVTCEFKYAASNARYTANPNFARIQDLDGNYIVLSAAVGELPQRYQDVELSYGLSQCIAVKNSDGAVGVIDMDGSEVLPFVSSASYTFSSDGSVIACNVKGQTTIYTIGAQNSASSSEVSSTEVSSEASNQQTDSFISLLHDKITQQESAPANDDSWVCACGSVNEGNFCPQCGSARPAEEKVIVCAGCGYQPDQENVPNFCPECGQKFAK